MLRARLETTSLRQKKGSQKRAARLRAGIDSGGSTFGSCSPASPGSLTAACTAVPVARPMITASSCCQAPSQVALALSRGSTASTARMLRTSISLSGRAWPRTWAQTVTTANCHTGGPWSRGLSAVPRARPTVTTKGSNTNTAGGQRSKRGRTIRAAITTP